MQAHLSPRSQYLADCERGALVPEPMGALSRDQGTTLDLRCGRLPDIPRTRRRSLSRGASMYGLGDTYAQAMRAQQVAHVRNINLRGNHLTSRGVQALTAGLHACATPFPPRCSRRRRGSHGPRPRRGVERLNLSDNAIGGAGVRALSEWIHSRGGKLTSLTLENVGLTERSAAQLMDVLSRRPALQRLNVGRNWIGVRGAAALVNLIRTSSALKELYMSWVGFGPRSAVSVAEGASSPTTVGTRPLTACALDPLRQAFARTTRCARWTCRGTTCLRPCPGLATLRCRRFPMRCPTMSACSTWIFPSPVCAPARSRC